MRKIIISLLVLISFIMTSGCTKEEDLSKYGIKEETQVKSSEINNINGKKDEEMQKSEEKKENEEVQENEEILKNEEENKIKYPISGKIPSDLRIKNEKYISEIIEILNAEYYLGNNINISAREKDELDYNLESKIGEYRTFVQDNGIGEKELDNGYEKYTLDTYLNSFYYDVLRVKLNETDNIESQKYISKFISYLTMIDYSQVVNDRSELIGESIYKPGEITNFICNNEEISSTYIDSYMYDEIKDIYNRDLYNVSNFMEMKFDDGKGFSDNLKNKLKSYLDVYEKWINSFEDSKSVINNEERYYNESKQIELYEEMKFKIEDINTEINDTYEI